MNGFRVSVFLQMPTYKTTMFKNIPVMFQITMFCSVDTLFQYARLITEYKR